MTHTLSGLEARGLIDMRPNPKDGRSKRVWLTDDGRRLRDQAIEALDPDIEVIAERFPRQKIEELVPRLAAIREVLDAYRDTLTFPLE